MSEPPLSPDPADSGIIVVRWWHVVIGCCFTLLMVFLIPGGRSPEFSHLTVGSISQTKIIAPFDFPILKSTEELKKERAETAGSVLPVLTRIDSVREVYNGELLRFASESHAMFSQLSDTGFAFLDDSSLFFSLTGTISWSPNLPLLSHADSLSLENGKDFLFNQFGFRLADETWRFLLDLYVLDRKTQPGIYFRLFEQHLSDIILDIFVQGVINTPKKQITHPSGKVTVQQSGEEMLVELERLLTIDEALARISALLPERLKESEYPLGFVSATYEMLLPFVAANIYADEQETDRRKLAAIAKVPLAKGLVKKDELIIDRNIRVTPEHVAKLNSLASRRVELQIEQGGVRQLMPVAGHFVLTGCVVLLFGAFIAFVRREIWSDWKLLLLITVILTLILIFQRFVPVQYELSQYMFPAAVGAMLLAILVDRGIAMAGVMAMALVAGLIGGNDYQAAFIVIAVGSTALVAVRNVRTRGDIMRSSFYLAGVSVLLVLSFHLIRFSVDGQMLGDLAVASVNAVFTPMLVLGLVFIFERIFGVTTDLSLLELVDLNHPLLRELAMKSPGTYHHSIMVGNLAEAAARDIGANSLLTRAGAYYHDIGKMENKEYFIENQETGSENIHDQLPPSKSAEVVIGHVHRGLYLAEQHKLPPQVMAFISEHHGKTRLAFFLAKAKQEQGKDWDCENKGE